MAKLMLYRIFANNYKTKDRSGKSLLIPVNILKIKLKTILKVLLILASIPTTNAQKNSLWFSSGYLYGDARSRDINDLAWGKARNYTLGTGTTTQLFFQHQPDSSNWILGCGINALIGNRNIVRIHENADTMQAATVTSNSLRLVFQLGYLWNIRKLNFQLNAGIILPISTKIKGETSYRDSLKNSNETSVIKNYFSIGFKSNLSCSYRVNKNIRFFVSLEQVLLNSKVKKRTITNYESSDNKKLADIYPTVSDKETNYRKNIESIRNNPLLLPKAFNTNIATDKLSYSQSYSSIGFIFGFQFIF
jgi:hypothetical protein